MNWFGNNLDWSTFPFEKADNTRGYTPDGCTEEVLEGYVSQYGLFCSVFMENDEGVWYNSHSCQGDCMDGYCVNGDGADEGIYSILIVII